VKVKGIRGQLFLAFGALVLVINLFYARLNYLFVNVTQDIVATIMMEQEISHLQSDWQNGHQLRLSSSYFKLYDQTQINALGDLEPIIHEQTLFKYAVGDDYGYVVELSFVGSQVIYLVLVASDMLPLVSFANVFSVFLVSVAIAAMILAVLSTWFLAGKLSEPLRRLTSSVARQQPQSPCNIAGTNRPDEIGQLANAFSNTYVALQDAWRREHDFANDVSHELRTPIALIRNTLTLNNSGVFKQEECQLLEQATATLHQTVEVLLALARKENMTFFECAMTPLVERAVLSILKSHPDSLFNVDVAIDDNLKVYGNPNLISLLCQNLVNNGFYHGDGEGMRIYSQSGSLIFENPIRNSASRVNYQGLGHGQYLVGRISRAMHWNVATEQCGDSYRVQVKPLAQQHQQQKTSIVE
jgi:signal transduction histidine kinase